MTWQLMWRNMRAATLNATLQLLVILAVNLRVTRDNYFYGGFINFFSLSFFGVLDCSYIIFMIVPIINKNIITKYITHY